MASLVQRSIHRRRPGRRWARHLAIWVAVLGTMSAGRCRRKDELVVARAQRSSDAPLAGSADTSTPSAPSGGRLSRHPGRPHVLGMQPRASRRLPGELATRSHSVRAFSRRAP